MEKSEYTSLVIENNNSDQISYRTSSFISRRRFLQYSLAMSLSVAAGSVLSSGCAVNPVSGKQEIMLVSRQQEIAIDRAKSVFQFSADYGISQDQRINKYLGSVGKRLLPYVQRPEMPYDFHCVNAVYINAYAFPGGSIAATRGILLKLENEAQLASLLGHELGHVNARHTAEQITAGQLSSLILSGLSLAAGSKSDQLGKIAYSLGMLGQGIFLSRYSRDHERQADFLGNEYMVRAGYPSKGFVELMEILNSMHREKQGATNLLFATHPMSSERLRDAIKRDRKLYAYSDNALPGRERYMDNTFALRTKKEGIELLQKGEEKLGARQYHSAENIFMLALKKLPYDYTAHVLMAKCCMVRKKSRQALFYADTAKMLYPSETQAHYIAGLANKDLKRYMAAYQNFSECEKLLPGNPQVTFYRGYCREKTGSLRPAAVFYMNYLKMINYRSDRYSRYAYNRLKQWGYIK